MCLCLWALAKEQCTQLHVPAQTGQYLDTSNDNLHTSYFIVLHRHNRAYIYTIQRTFKLHNNIVHLHARWNLSNTDTLGTRHTRTKSTLSTRYRELLSYITLYIYMLGGTCQIRTPWGPDIHVPRVHYVFLTGQNNRDQKTLIIDVHVRDAHEIDVQVHCIPVSAVSSRRYPDLGLASTCRCR